MQLALRPSAKTVAPKCNALIICVPTVTLRRLSFMHFASPIIRNGVLRRIIATRTQTALHEMCSLPMERDHPARALVGTLLEPLFASTLRKGGLFEIRSLRPDPVTDSSVVASSAALPHSGRPLCKHPRTGEAVKSAALGVRSARSPCRYLRLTLQASGELAASMMADAPEDEKTRPISEDVLLNPRST